MLNYKSLLSQILSNKNVIVLTIRLNRLHTKKQLKYEHICWFPDQKTRTDTTRRRRLTNFPTSKETRTQYIIKHLCQYVLTTFISCSNDFGIMFYNILNYVWIRKQSQKRLFNRDSFECPLNPNSTVHNKWVIEHNIICSWFFFKTVLLKLYSLVLFSS